MASIWTTSPWCLHVWLRLLLSGVSGLRILGSVHLCQYTHRSSTYLLQVWSSCSMEEPDDPPYQV